MKQVTYARRHHNAVGRDVWKVQLECGHQRIYPGHKKSPPVRLKCPRCEREED